MIKFFWIPKEVWYYVVFPIFGILIIYLLFNLFYNRKKNSYYYNYVVDSVYSTLGIVFCGLLFCLLLGYSIATIQILNTNNLIKTYSFLIAILAILPIIPIGFLIYVISIFCKNLKRKAILDKNLKIESSHELSSKSSFNSNKTSDNEFNNKVNEFDKIKFKNNDLETNYIKPNDISNKIDNRNENYNNNFEINYESVNDYNKYNSDNIEENNIPYSNEESYFDQEYFPKKIVKDDDELENDKKKNLDTEINFESEQYNNDKTNDYIDLNKKKLIDPDEQIYDKHKNKKNKRYYYQNNGHNKYYNNSNKHQNYYYKNNKKNHNTNNDKSSIETSNNNNI